MRIIPSVCSNLWFPDSRGDIGAFRHTAEFLAETGVRCMEYYHDGAGAAKTGRILQDCALQSVLIGVIPLKERHLCLCGSDDHNRAQAVALCKQLARQATDSGARSLMVCSGANEPDNDAACFEALLASIEDMSNDIRQYDLPVELELEPCDSAMDARQFVGPYQRTLALCEALNRRGIDLALTMDSAHTVEEGQNFLEALAATRDFCRHVHLANCVIGDPAHPLYGDKHLGYEYQNTPWSFDAINALAGPLESLYPGDESLMIGLEALCRQPDPYAYFKETWARLPFLSATKGGRP